MSAWSDFRLEVFGEPYYVWHDGPDFTEVARRYAADPAGVTALLGLGLAQGDALAAETCRHLEVAGTGRAEVVALLRRHASATGALATEVAASLHALGEDAAEQAAAITAVLHTGDFWGVRMDAARRLAAFAPTPALVAALARAVQDEDYLVRFHAATTLRAWAGVTESLDRDHELFGLVAGKADPDGWARAAERLADAVTR